jgi:hypothetical protein
MVEANFYHTACGSGNLILRRSSSYSGDPICGIYSCSLVPGGDIRDSLYLHIAMDKDVVIVGAYRVN